MGSVCTEGVCSSAENDVSDQVRWVIPDDECCLKHVTD